MKPLPHQIAKSEEAWLILKEKGYVYLAFKPRVGKTLTSMLICEKSAKVKSVLILTKKAAISGWTKFIDDPELALNKSYYVTNYEQAHKLKSEDYDILIADESHNLGAYPKMSQRVKTIKQLCYNMPHIHLSGTAIVESPNSIYNQMSISKYNPFKQYRNFYDFFRDFGKPYYIRINGREIQQYDKCQWDKLKPIVDSFTVYAEQHHAGIDKSVQAVDKIHYVELNVGTRNMYNMLQKDCIMSFCKDCGNYWSPTYTYCPICESFDEIQLVADSTMKLRTSLHMMESGIAKIGDKYIELGNTEKIDYIKEKWGDREDMGIMSHFIGERKLLAKHFKKAKIFSSNAHSEGVDLSHLKTFIVLSSDYSGARFIQRRERIISVNGSNTLEVNHILVKKAISDMVFSRVSKKQDFNNSTYEATTI